MSKRTRAISLAAVSSAVFSLLAVTGAFANHNTSISLDPATQSVAAGQTATYNGTVVSQCGEPGDPPTHGWQLSVSGAPAGSTTTLTPDSQAVGGPVSTPYTLTIEVPAGATPGSYSVTVTATFTFESSDPGCIAGDPNLQRTATVTLDVTPGLPTSKDQCKNGGWQNYGGKFKNQGDCVSFVATGGKNPPTNP
jgi:hypothetical protein